MSPFHRVPASFEAMNLRTKLLLGYLIFVAALVVLGGWSAWRLREMGGVSRRIISNNYDSVVAAQEMKESLERQDSAALFALLGARDKAMAQLREHRARFDANFQKAENNITEVGEPEAIETIRRDRDTYYQLFDAFIAKLNAAESSQLQGVARDEELQSAMSTSHAWNRSSTSCAQTANTCCNSINAPCLPSPRRPLVWLNSGSTARCYLQVC